MDFLDYPLFRFFIYLLLAAIFFNPNVPKIKSYLFCWDEIPENNKDNLRLISFLSRMFNLNLLSFENLEKIDDRTINVSFDKESFSLNLNDEKTKVDLKKAGEKITELIVEMEDNVTEGKKVKKLKIYKKSNRGFILIYWIGILISYFFISNMIVGGFIDFFSNYTENFTISTDLELQFTITSLGLLFFTRIFSRYLDNGESDESTRWIADFIQGIITSYIAIFALFYAFSDYFDSLPQLEVFSRDPIAFVVLGICFVIDLLKWLDKISQKNNRYIEKRIKYI